MKSLKNLSLDHVDWAVAAPISFDEMVRIPIATKNDWDIVGTPDGFSVLFVVGSFEAERLARKLAVTAGTAYSLDFDDEAPRVIAFSSDGDTDYREEHPATFLKERGVIAPGYGPNRACGRAPSTWGSG